MTTILQKVAPILIDHKHGLDMLRELVSWRSMVDKAEYPIGWDFDVAESTYYVGTRWHGGQGCPLYSAMCATGFESGPCWTRPERGTMAADIAASLVRILSR